MACAATQRIGQSVTGELIGERIADDVESGVSAITDDIVYRDAGKVERCRPKQDRIRAGRIPHHVTGTINDIEVIARTPRHAVIAQATIQRVVAIAAQQGVATVATIQQCSKDVTRNQRVIARFAKERLARARAANQAVIIVAAINGLTIAPTRSERVIAGFAIEVLTSAVPAMQAIGIIAAIKGLITATARDQRVIPGFA